MLIPFSNNINSNNNTNILYKNILIMINYNNNNHILTTMVKKASRNIFLYVNDNDDVNVLQC